MSPRRRPSLPPPMNTRRTRQSLPHVVSEDRVSEDLISEERASEGYAPDNSVPERSPSPSSFSSIYTYACLEL